MSSTRRTVLITSGAAVLVAGAGWALTRSPRAARAPWRAAGESLGDPRLDCLAFAVLAPNPHNMQPWRIQLEGDDAFRVYTDQSRLLPEIDPFSRQIAIGFGCFLELARMAAAAKGYRAEMTPFPDGEDPQRLDDRPVAHMRLVADAEVEADPLMEAVLDRRTNRAVFDVDHAVSTSDLEAILRGATAGPFSLGGGFANDPPTVDALRTLTTGAWKVEWTNDATRRESIDVTRIGKREINDDPWGLSLNGPIIDALGAAGVLTRAKTDNPGSLAYDQSFAFYERACQSAAAFLWTTSPTNTRRDQLAAGGAWLRAQLEATRRGLAFHPLSQALQEFPAMETLYRKAHRMLVPEGGTVQMLARLGYAPQPAPAPREPLEAKLIAV